MEYCDERVDDSLYVCPLKNHIPKFMNFFVHVTCSHGSVLLSRQCNTLCTSGFVDDVIFARNRSGKGDANRAYMLKVAHRLSYYYYPHHHVTIIIIIIIIKCYRFSDILFLPVFVDVSSSGYCFDIRKCLALNIEYLLVLFTISRT